MGFLEDENLMLAESYLEQSEYGKAKEVLEQILEIDPGYGPAHNHLGWIYYARLENLERAEYHYNLAIKFSPLYVNTYVNKVNLLSAMGRHEELLAFAKEALEIPTISHAYINNMLGISHERQGRFAAAEGFYLKAEKLEVDTETMNQYRENRKRARLKYKRFERSFLSLI